MTDSNEICVAILTDLGTDHRCFKLVSSLKEMGYSPIIYCDKPRNALSPGWQNFKIVTLTKTSHYDGFGKAFLPFLLKLTKAVLTSKSRTWLVLDCPPLFWVAFLGKIRSLKIIYDSHEIFLETPLVKSRASRKLFWSFWHNAGMALIDKMIVVSPLCEQYFKELYPSKKIFLLPNAPPKKDFAVFSKPPPGKNTNLIFQGGLRVATGLEETMDALKSLPHFNLQIFGFGPEETSLKLRMQSLKLESQVTFHGAIPFNELVPHMELADIGIHLMQPICKSFALTLANKLFDYVHALTPVLLSDNPAHREFLLKHPVGIVVDSYSPEAIKNGLEKLKLNLEFHQQACLKAREEWHWNKFAQKLPAFLLS